MNNKNKQEYIKILDELQTLLNEYSSLQTIVNDYKTGITTLSEQKIKDLENQYLRISKKIKQLKLRSDTLKNSL